ncbi:MAG: HAD-IB family hydrolase, partial [Bowdeniella nasicola]|nr:HAD-IB family hydrolase [Bowdeniella nasicola]
RDAGHAIVIVSASAEAIVKPIAAMLGATHVIASKLTEKDGRYTGQISSYAYGPAKAEQMAALAAQHGWDLNQCWAYSDSITDVPMLTLVGHPVAVNPDRALRAIATEGGWQIRQFSIRVPLSARRAIPVLTIVTLAALAATAWWLRRRR